jgi:hypothetical protein
MNKKEAMRNPMGAIGIPLGGKMALALLERQENQ